MATLSFSSYLCHVKATLHGLWAGLILTCGCFAQIVVPAAPNQFQSRSIGGGASIGGGVEVVPKEEAAKKTRYITHIVLSESHIWSSTDGKILTGKLIAFEDMVVETPQGAAAPVTPTPPAHPTLIRDGKVRLLVNQKAVEIPLERIAEADRELITNIKAALDKKAAPSSQQ